MSQCLPLWWHIQGSHDFVGIEKEAEGEDWAEGGDHEPRSQTRDRGAACHLKEQDRAQDEAGAARPQTHDGDGEVPVRGCLHMLGFFYCRVLHELFYDRDGEIQVRWCIQRFVLSIIPLLYVHTSAMIICN